LSLYLANANDTGGSSGSTTYTNYPLLKFDVGLSKLLQVYYMDLASAVESMTKVQQIVVINTNAYAYSGSSGISNIFVKIDLSSQPSARPSVAPSQGPTGASAPASPPGGGGGGGGGGGRRLYATEDLIGIAGISSAEEVSDSLSSMEIFSLQRTAASREVRAQAEQAASQLSYQRADLVTQPVEYVTQFLASQDSDAYITLSTIPTGLASYDSRHPYIYLFNDNYLLRQIYDPTVDEIQYLAEMSELDYPTAVEYGYYYGICDGVTGNYSLSSSVLTDFATACDDING
jgi:hypothetical protein